MSNHSDNQFAPAGNHSITMQLEALAGNANISYVTNDKQGLIDSLVKLYNMVHGYNSHKLKALEATAGQCVGLAFIKMAIFFNNGDTRVNEIAAQNAFYCIAKNYLITRNTTAIPALFTLLIKKTQTLEDELYDISPDPSLIGLGGMLPSASIRRKTRVIRNAICIMGYLLPKFYDIHDKRYTVDQSLPYHIPTNQDIARFYEIVERFNISYDKNTIDVGEEYFEKLYNNIEEQLNL